ncbi:MAG: TspO/MBR family protein [Desulfobacca sp.]|uniref:TspO/MBR family protein n=1 Tax=Desulfobacca sp. TaxID=2067990 RepID=UPI00404A0FD8
MLEDSSSSPPSQTGRWLGLAFWLALSYVAAWTGSRFPPGDWYARLLQPALTPPSWLFAPVWTVLYTLMGVAAWLVWQRAGARAAAWPLALFVLQVALNGLWSYLFFGLQRPGLALLDITALWLAVLATILAFWRYHRPAGQLLLPYLLWLSFAVYLNWAFWRLNL